MAGHFEVNLLKLSNFSGAPHFRLVFFIEFKRICEKPVHDFKNLSLYSIEGEIIFKFLSRSFLLPKLLKRKCIYIYNSVDKSYFDKATNVFNEQYKTSEQTNEDLNSLDDDELDDELERLLKEKEERRRKRNKDFEM